ncbi:hypothetical protein ACFVVQ_03920 [Paenibacillus chitinolyticus]|uniref:hypothetical protein n=1 Tax=Paenibacillus chitinolyticus TaxID=79263 RepID=UPI0036D8EC2D
MEIIQPYSGSLYLKCSKMQLISYLSHIEVPVELLFYNALESSDEIFHNIVIECKSRYQYRSKILNDEDLAALGIKLHYENVDKLVDAEEIIIKMLDKFKAVFLPLDQFYFPHRLFYNKEHIFHSFIITNHITQGNENFFFLTDFDPNFSDYVKNSLVMQALTHLRFPVQFVSYEFKSEEISKNEIYRKYSETFDKHKDSYELYSWIISVLENDMKEETLKSIDHSLAILSGSRFLFSKYISLLKGHENLAHQLIKISKDAEVIKNLILKYRITNLLKKQKIIELVQQLQYSEQKLLVNLKSTLIK